VFILCYMLIILFLAVNNVIKGTEGRRDCYCILWDVYMRHGFFFTI